VHFQLVGLNKEARNVLAYGTDGEEELFKALKYNFPYAVHLRCFMHFRENCKTQLKKSNVPEAHQKEILADIFGRRVGDTWENGNTLYMYRLKTLNFFFQYT
jgi:hypothetical protein